jgi:hypothetical protein
MASTKGFRDGGSPSGYIQLDNVQLLMNYIGICGR